MKQELCHLPMFLRWRCLTHECGSYNFSQLVRHDIDSCEIIREETVGIIKPKSFGGYKGDLGRTYISEYQEEIRSKQKNESKLQKWLAWRAKKLRQIYRYKKRFANYSKRVQQYQRKENQKR